MRLLLISPSNKPGRKVLKAIRMPQLGLHIIASLTPEDIAVTVVDEQIRQIDFSLDFDLVGISCMTATANRSYQLADRYRQKGSNVVLGGIHPTILPEEAIQHADAVVIGEAEGCWADVIADFRNNRLRRFYHVPAPDLSQSPSPRRDFQIDKALFNCVGLVTTRGCPYACEFCSVTDFYGGKIRHRPVSMVVEDIKQSGSKAFLILDDNVAGHPEYSKQLFEALIPLGIQWVGQSSISLAKDKEMLRLCRLSGCAALFFGVESVSPASLIGLKKSLKSIEETEEAVKIIQDNGIAFHPSIILGFDTDTKAIFDDTLDFLARTRLPTMALACADALSRDPALPALQGSGTHHIRRLEPLRPSYRRISTQEHDPRGTRRGTPLCPKRVLFFLFDPSAYSVSVKSFSHKPQAGPGLPVTQFRRQTRGEIHRHVP